MLSVLLLALHTAPALAGENADGTYTIGSASSSKDSSSSSGSKDKKSSSSTESDGTVFKSFKVAGWKVKPYVSPGGGVQINGSDLSGVAAVDAGFKYSKKKWTGDLYAGGSYTTSGSGGTSGYDAHVGDETGARLKYWGATLGLVGAYNGYVFADGTVVKPAGSVSVPVQIVAGPKKYHLTGGIAPVITTDKSRHVDWSTTDAVGFGDEFSWNVGAAVKFKSFSGSVGFTQNVYGSNGKAVVTNTPTISVGLGDIISITQ